MPGRKADLRHIAEPLRALALPVGGLNPDPANTRVHEERNIDAIKMSLERFGQDQPIVVQKQGMIVRKGNARLAAAIALGWTHIAAIIVEESDIEAVVRAIADNRCAELARWDEPALARLLEVIRSDDTIDTTATGFQEDEIDALVHEVLNSPNSDDDIIPDPPGRPITRRGDVWRLGEHRLLCGDSAKPQDVGQLFGNESADLCVTSPPYNVGLCYPCAKDRLPRDEYLAFIRGVAEQVFAVLKSGRFLAWNLGVSPTTHVGRQLVTLSSTMMDAYRCHHC